MPESRHMDVSDEFRSPPWHWISVIPAEMTAVPTILRQKCSLDAAPAKFGNCLEKPPDSAMLHPGYLLPTHIGSGAFNSGELQCIPDPI